MNKKLNQLAIKHGKKSNKILRPKGNKQTFYTDGFDFTLDELCAFVKECQNMPDDFVKKAA